MLKSLVLKMEEWQLYYLMELLFRGASEGLIRQRILEDNLIDAVIGLPENLFYGVSIPATIVVF